MQAAVIRGGHVRPRSATSAERRTRMKDTMRAAGDPVRSGEAATSLYADFVQSDKFGIHMAHTAAVDFQTG